LKLKVAVVGLGKMGLLHASILGVMENVELAAFCEKKSLLRRFAAKMIPGIPFVSDIAELAGKQLDAVYVATPEGSHYPIIKTIYENKIARNVFVEKPLTANYERAQALCKLANASGGQAMVGYNRRYSVTFGKARQILKEGVLGELISFEGRAFSSDFMNAQITSPAAARSAALTDLGCHVIDLVLWCFGNMKIDGDLLTAPDAPEDWVNFQMSSANTAIKIAGDVKISRRMKNCRLPEIGLRIKGSKGALAVDEDKVELKLNGQSDVRYFKHDLGDAIPFFIGGTEYYREDAAFISAIAEGTKFEPDFNEAARVEAVIDRISRQVGEH
jgi:predicted dehydrogenase